MLPTRPGQKLAPASGGVSRSANRSTVPPGEGKHRAPRESDEALAQENANLRRELVRLKEQFETALTRKCNAPDWSPDFENQYTPKWLAAQLQQSQRQVAVLSEALLARSELSIELEAILVQLRQPAADGSRSEAAAWAAAALRRLRQVQFIEGIAPSLGDDAPQLHVVKPRGTPPTAKQGQRTTASGRAKTGAPTARPTEPCRSSLSTKTS
mmetsp:Transcript_24341/g.53160  ORF Transcript_24341/g.53160 Transcript_24341/m.53160 type:complete len:212 (+) Transcript_24341:218-853(+)|eukprot:6173533-Pleurochrysis_carterae.AAC.2